jgi:small subunit ribosomal protein S21
LTDLRLLQFGRPIREVLEKSERSFLSGLLSATYNFPEREGRVCSAADAILHPFEFLTRGENSFIIHLTYDGNACHNYRVHLGRVGGCSPLAEVRLQEGESLENALRRFKRKVQTEDIIKEVKRHSFYLKPGERKRVKEALARKRSRKKARKEQD